MRRASHAVGVGGRYEFLSASCDETCRHLSSNRPRRPRRRAPSARSCHPAVNRGHRLFLPRIAANCGQARRRFNQGQNCTRFLARASEARRRGQKVSRRAAAEIRSRKIPRRTRSILMKNGVNLPAERVALSAWTSRRVFSPAGSLNLTSYSEASLLSSRRMRATRHLIFVSCE